jgi:hypothetical protein
MGLRSLTFLRSLYATLTIFLVFAKAELASDGKGLRTEDVYTQCDQYHGHNPVPTAIQLSKNRRVRSQPLRDETPDRD